MSFLSVEIGNANVGFYKAADLPVRPQNLDRALAASATLLSKNSKCSGFFISTHGHFLTNIHCIEKCLRDQNAVDVIGVNSSSDDVERFIDDYQIDVRFSSEEFSKEMNSIIGDFWFRVTRVINRTPAPLSCSNITIPELGLKNPQVVLTGRGNSFSKLTLFENIPKAIKTIMHDSSDDFALLKFESKKKSLSCVNISNQQVKTGDPIWLIGSPNKVARDHQLGSDGVSEYISYGNVVTMDDIHQSMRNQGYRETTSKEIIQYLNLPHLQFLDVDIYRGSSGSMVINQKGAVVGIGFGGLFEPRQHVPNSSLAIDVQHIYRSALSLFGEEATSFFDCK